MISANNLLALLFCTGFAFLTGFFISRHQYRKATKRIRTLECEKLDDHAMILALHKQMTELAPKGEEQPVFYKDESKTKIA